jgi:hypothetical protein
MHTHKGTTVKLETNCNVQLLDVLLECNIIYLVFAVQQYCYLAPLGLAIQSAQCGQARVLRMTVT